MHTPVTTRATPATAPAASRQPARRRRATPAEDQPLPASGCGIDSNADCGATAKTQATAPAGAETSALTVLYDGGCPLCRREIALYRELPAREAVHYLDISTASAAQLPAGAAREALLARFHVRRADGRLVDGAAGFVALWAALPGWRWLARVAALPGVTPVMELAYRGFLRLRPRMQRLAAAFEPPALHVPADLVADLRSDHAGETGAVWIYHGVLALSRDRDVRAFARRHRETEQAHLARITPLLPWPQRSRLLPAWRVAGFLTGALPALFGPRAVYATIEAVETFVDQHYQQQVERLDAHPDGERVQPLRALLAECQADECCHRDEAAGAAVRPAGPVLRAWCTLVGRGSALAVGLARRI
jgi:3-demethoxyubiquinol 3-hydroxylase